jgi:hypothetical protein
VHACQCTCTLHCIARIPNCYGDDPQRFSRITRQFSRQSTCNLNIILTLHTAWLACAQLQALLFRHTQHTTIDQHDMSCTTHVIFNGEYFLQQIAAINATSPYSAVSLVITPTLPCCARGISVASDPCDNTCQVHLRNLAGPSDNIGASGIVGENRRYVCHRRPELLFQPLFGVLQDIS